MVVAILRAADQLADPPVAALSHTQHRGVPRGRVGPEGHAELDRKRRPPRA